MGYKIIADDKADKQVTNAIFDRRDYEEAFFRDLVEANKEVVISSPRLNRYKVNKAISFLKPRQENGVGVTLITMNPEAVGYEDTIEHKLLIDSLQKAGVVVRTTDEYAECYAVIDKIIVWHGGMNLLGNTYKGDNLIRIENMQAAEELLEITDQLLK